jgi:hypothetical protein
VRESGRVYDVAVTDTGTNRTELAAAIVKVKPGASVEGVGKLIQSLPAVILKGADRKTADAVAEKLQVGDSKVEVRIVPLGPDIALGWGKRRSVAADFLFDQPVMPGSQRIGPDLASVGSRWPGTDLQLLHLYNPQITVKKSVMPPYPFLFEKRKINRGPSLDALKVAGNLVPEAGYEIVPTDDARSLVAYLLSLRTDTPVFEAPLTVPPAPPAADTNAPANAATNSPSK